MVTKTHIKVKQLEHFINGQFCHSASGEKFHSINPATGEVFAEVALGKKEDIDLAVQAANESFQNGPWRKMSVKERCQVLRKIGDIILEQQQFLAEAETQDTGKPISESLYGDIPRAAQNFHFFADFAQSQAEECFTLNGFERHLAVREPAGVAALITPWNLPLYLATWKIAPCLAMGNSCVLKPAEWTPYTATLLARIVTEAGLPEGVLNIVHGYGTDGAGEALTGHKDVKLISFTGETSTGKAIMSNAASSLKKLSFELGGKGANIIFADADIDEAIETAVHAAFRNQGQICLAGSRLYVERNVYERVVEGLIKRVSKLKVGDPLEKTTEMGAIISQEQLDKILSFIELGKREGDLLIGGNRLLEFPNGYFLSPALFAGLQNNSKLCQQEIFGPVLPIIPFTGEEEVVEMVNSTAYGLSASFWTKDIDRCHRLSQKIQAGIVWVNCWFSRDLRTPFGGQKSSGIGREGGRWSLDFFCELKTICHRYKL